MLVNRAQKRKLRGISVLLASVLLAVFLSVTNAFLRPILCAMAQSRVEEAVISAVQTAILAQLSGEYVAYSELVTLHMDASGRVSALSCHTQRMNKLRASLLRDIQESLDALGEQDFSIPWGNLTNLNLLSGRGPTVTVRVQTASAAAAEFEHSFLEAGINQTLHQIQLKVDVNINILLPGQHLELPVSTCVTVAETVIVGDVPDTYVQSEQ